MNFKNEWNYFHVPRAIVAHDMAYMTSENTQTILMYLT